LCNEHLVYSDSSKVNHHSVFDFAYLCLDATKKQHCTTAVTKSNMTENSG